MKDGRCIFEGSFGDIHIPDVLTFLDMLGKTGTLEVRREDEQRRLFWDTGEIVYADSNLPDQSLSGWLLCNGRISPAEHDEARKAGKKDETIIAQLVKIGALEPALLPRASRGLVLDIVYALFEWNEGRFRFLVTQKPHDERVVLRTSVSNIIMEGSRRLDEWRRIRTVFKNDRVHPVPGTEEPPASVKLSDVEEEILGHVDGKRSVFDIIGLVEHDQFTTLTALHALQTTGFIGVSDTPLNAAAKASEGNGLSSTEAETARAIVDVFNNIFAGIHQRVMKTKGDPGRERFTSTLQKQAFRATSLFSGVEFSKEGRLPEETLLRNVSTLEADHRIQRLKGSMDRLLAQQVLQMDNSYASEDKKAISELISSEKGRLPASA